MLRKRNLKYPITLAVPALIIYTIFIIIPIVAALCLSFTDWNIRRWEEPVFYGIENYKSVIQDEVFITGITNSLLYAFGTSILKVVVGLLLALALVKPFKSNSVLRTIYYLPCVLSVTVVGVLFSSILSLNGLLNNMLNGANLAFLTKEWLGSYDTAMFWIIFIDTWMWAGFNMFIFISGLQAISSDYYEVGDIEGASKVTQFFKITLPLLIPAITVNTTLNIAGGIKVFDIVYVLTGGGPGNSTQVLSTYAFRAFGLGFLGESAAAGIILTVLVVIISFTLNKIFRRLEVEV